MLIARLFSSPFLGTFFQFNPDSMINKIGENSFRPLSWGLSFNHGNKEDTKMELKVFVPFLGDFLSIRYANCGYYVDST